MNVTPNGLADIKVSEGFSSKPYWDRYGSVWTIGYGETDGIGPNTRPISKAEAERRLIARFAKDYAWALKPFENLKGFNQNRYDALASFIWNCGVYSVAKGTGVGDALRRRDWHGATQVMLKWNKAGGKFMQGLYDRRVREIKLFNKPPKTVARSDREELTTWELKHVNVLESERRSARRNKAWSKIDKSHKANAKVSKAWLEARVKAIPGSKPLDRAARRREMLAVINNDFHGI